MFFRNAAETHIENVDGRAVEWAKFANDERVPHAGYDGAFRFLAHDVQACSRVYTVHEAPTRGGWRVSSYLDQDQREIGIFATRAAAVKAVRLDILAKRDDDNNGRLFA